MTPITVDMETYPSPPEARKFMARFQRFEPVILDHTAMIAAKDCLRKYFYQIVLGRTPKEEAIYFAWGSAYHCFRDVLQREYGFGDSAPAKWDEARAANAFATAAQAGTKYWREHGRDQEPDSKYSFMTMERLLRSFRVAYEHWSRETQRGVIRVIAVEQPFNVQMPDGTSRAGRADQIVRWSGKLWGRDFKTSTKEGAWYERTLDPNEQFTGYTWAEAQLSGESIQGQLVEVLYNAKPTKNDSKGPTIVELTASRTTYQVETWVQEHQFYKRIIDMCREEDIWPMMEVGCSFCPYHSVCKQSSEASMMYQLETQFTLRPWDHSKVGHDV